MLHKIRLSFIKITALSLLLTCGVVGVANAQTPPAAPPESPFSSAKEEACKGANLSDTSTGCEADNPSGGKLETTLSNIINLLSVIIGIAAVIVIMINGLRFITANGDANSITSARNGIIYSLIGLIIVALAQIIVRFVLSKV